MKPSDLTKYYGMFMICEICNWDLADIKQFYLRNSNICISTQLSRLLRNYKEFINNEVKPLTQGYYIKEILEKLGGNEIE